MLQVEPPREEPKLPGNYVGFTENAEVWNSRAGMIGIFGIILVELVRGDCLQTELWQPCLLRGLAFVAWSTHETVVCSSRSMFAMCCI